MGVREGGSPGPWSEQVGWRRVALEWAGREWLGRSSPGKPGKFPRGGRWRGSRVDAASHAEAGADRARAVCTEKAGAPWNLAVSTLGK